MSRRTGAITLQDVASEAGVSAMTVSVVINGASSQTRVSEITRERIREVAQRMRYRPNAVARALSRRRLDTIGVVADVDGVELNLYFLEALSGILESAHRHGQNTTVLSIGSWEHDEDRILKFCDGRVDGILFIGPIRQPVREMGQRAVDVLMSRIAEQGQNLAKSTPLIEVFPVELVVRESVGQPRPCI